MLRVFLKNNSSNGSSNRSNPWIANLSEVNDVMMDWISIPVMIFLFSYFSIFYSSFFIWQRSINLRNPQIIMVHPDTDACISTENNNLQKIQIIWKLEKSSTNKDISWKLKSRCHIYRGDYFRLVKAISKNSRWTIDNY